MSRNSVFHSGRHPPDLRLERSAEQWEGSIPADAPQPRLDVQQGGGEPTLLLGAVGPGIDPSLASWPPPRLLRRDAVLPRPLFLNDSEPSAGHGLRVGKEGGHPSSVKEHHSLLRPDYSPADEIL